MCWDKWRACAGGMRVRAIAHVQQFVQRPRQLLRRSFCPDIHIPGAELPSTLYARKLVGRWAALIAIFVQAKLQTVACSQPSSSGLVLAGAAAAAACCDVDGKSQLCACLVRAPPR